MLRPKVTVSLVASQGCIAHSHTWHLHAIAKKSNPWDSCIATVQSHQVYFLNNCNLSIIPHLCTFMDSMIWCFCMISSVTSSSLCNRYTAVLSICYQHIRSAASHKLAQCHSHSSIASYIHSYIIILFHQNDHSMEPVINY